MKPLVLAAILAACLLRLHYWKSHREAAQALCSWLQHEAKLGRSQALIGSIVPLASDRWRLASVRSANGKPFPIEVIVSDRLIGKAPVFGREVRISGPLSCLEPRRNPGRLADGLSIVGRPRALVFPGRFRLALSRRPARWTARFCVAYRDWLLRLFAPSPGLAALVVSAWTG